MLRLCIAVFLCLFAEAKGVSHAGRQQKPSRTERFRAGRRCSFSVWENRGDPFLRGAAMVFSFSVFRHVSSFRRIRCLRRGGRRLRRVSAQVTGVSAPCRCGSFLRRIRCLRRGGGVSFCAERRRLRVCPRHAGAVHFSSASGAFADAAVSLFVRSGAGYGCVRAMPVRFFSPPSRALSVRFIFPSAPGPLPGRAASSVPRRGISGEGVSGRTTGSSALPERRRRHRSDPYREY